MITSMKYRVVEQSTMLEDGFYMRIEAARSAARELKRRYGGYWQVDSVPDGFPGRKDRFHASYPESRVREMITKATGQHRHQC